MKINEYGLQELNKILWIGDVVLEGENDIYFTLAEKMTKSKLRRAIRNYNKTVTEYQEFAIVLSVRSVRKDSNGLVLSARIYARDLRDWTPIEPEDFWE